MRVLLLQLVFPLMALLGLLNPYLAVCYYSFISVVRPEQLTYGSAQIDNVFAMAIASVLLSCLVHRQRLGEALRQSYFQFFIAFVAALYLSTLISPFTTQENSRSMYYLNQLPQILVFCLCLYTVLWESTPERLQLYLKLLVGCFLFMGLWGIDQYFRGNEVVERLFGSAITDRCAITGVYVMYLPLGVHLAKSSQRVTRLFGMVSVAVFATMVVLTQSRAGFLGFCLVLAVMFCYSRRKKLFLASASLLLVVGLLLVPDSYYERIGQIEMQQIDGEITDHSSASRLLLWRVALGMVSDNLVLGVGNLNFDKASSGYLASVKGSVDSALYRYTFGADDKSQLSHTHNTFLNILVEGGLLAGIPYYLMILVTLWRGHRLNRALKGVEDERLELLNLVNAGILGFLVTAFFANLIFLDYLYWNLTLSSYLCYLLKKRLSQEAEREQATVEAAGAQATLLREQPF